MCFPFFRGSCKLQVIKGVCKGSMKVYKDYTGALYENSFFIGLRTFCVEDVGCKMLNFGFSGFL